MHGHWAVAPVFLLPVDVTVAASQAMIIAAFAPLIAWTSWYVRRAAARGV